MGFKDYFFPGDHNVGDIISRVTGNAQADSASRVQTLWPRLHETSHRSRLGKYITA